MSDLDKTHNILHQLIKKIICIQILLQVGRLEQNIQLYGVRHSVSSAVFCIAWLKLIFPCSSWFVLS